MASADQQVAPIPEGWRTRVAAILRRADRKQITSTLQADLDWEAAFPDAWDFDRREALAGALETKGIVGRRIIGMKEAGEIYAFWFHFRNRQLYGKINLLPTGRIILIYSSHLPRKGKETL